MKLLLTVLTLIFAFVAAPHFAFAEDSKTEKAVEAADEVKDDAVKNTKKGWRNVKKAGRKAVGKNTVLDDAKDASANAADEIKDKADDVKKKID